MKKHFLVVSLALGAIAMGLTSCDEESREAFMWGYGYGSNPDHYYAPSATDVETATDAPTIEDSRE